MLSPLHPQARIISVIGIDLLPLNIGFYAGHFAGLKFLLAVS